MKTKITLTHLDNCFFLLTPQQAKALSIDGTLPRVGYEIKARADLSDVTLLRHDRQPLRVQPEDADHAWIKRTRHQEEIHFAIQFHFPPR